MLAGISHDLRTPLARLRLETEMSVTDEDARDHMAADIAQLDSIIDKFLDYARPDHVDVTAVLLRDVVDACTYAVQDHDDIRIKVEVPADLRVTADEVEITRVLSNLVENARRYGQTPGTGILASGEGASYCRDNLIASFATGIETCEDNGGNVVHP